MPTVKDGLQQVSEILKKGWTKGSMENHRGERCLVGACRLAFVGDAMCRGMTWYPEELTRAEDLLEECVHERGLPHISLTMFNDSSRTELKHVLEVVECAIKKAD